MTEENLEEKNSIEHPEMIIGDSNNFENQIEKEEIVRELEKIDIVRKILEDKYPSYGVLRDFINHLASTEKVFALAGIKKFGGDEIMDMFIDSESGVMSNETGIDKSVFGHIKKEFLKTQKTVGDIKNITRKLMEKYPESSEFISYMENYLILLLETSKEISQFGLSIDEEKEKVIHEMMLKIAENDNAEMEELTKIYGEFKTELEKIEN